MTTLTPHRSTSLKISINIAKLLAQVTPVLIVIDRNILHKEFTVSCNGKMCRYCRAANTLVNRGGIKAISSSSIICTITMCVYK